jgi:hypothetical protein
MIFFRRSKCFLKIQEPQHLDLHHLATLALSSGGAGGKDTVHEAGDIKNNILVTPSQSFCPD